MVEMGGCYDMPGPILQRGDVKKWTGGGESQM